MRPATDLPWNRLRPARTRSGRKRRTRGSSGFRALLLAACLAGEAFAQGVPVEVATPAQRDEATALYRAAVQALDSGKPEEALPLLEKSLALVASPNSRLMLARTLARLGRHPDAFVELEEVIETSRLLSRAQPKYEQTLHSAMLDLEEQKAHVAIVHLEVDGVLTLNGQPLVVGASSRRVVLAPGQAVFRLALANGGQVERTLDLVAGGEVKVDLNVPAVPSRPVVSAAPAPPPEPPQSNAISRDALGWVSAGVGVAGFLGFGIFGAAATSDANQLAARCVAEVCPDSMAPVAERGRSFQVAANVGLALGIVGAGAATFFFWPRLSTGWFEADVAVGPTSVRAGGRF